MEKVIYTDGSCLSNPGPGGWAFCILGDEHDDVVSDAGADDDYLGEILLDGFVDEGCGPTAAIGRKAPLGELSLEILSLRGVTPDGAPEKSQPAVMMKIGGSWAMLPAAASNGNAPPAWRREVIAAVYDGADCAEIGVFDHSNGDAPLGFVNIPVRRLPRGFPMVSTLALMGGVNANPIAEVTVRAHYKPLISAGATLFQLFAPPLPRSAYIFGNAIGRGRSFHTIHTQNHNYLRALIRPI